MAAMAMAPRQQTLSLHDMLRDMAAQEHLLLMGNQGVGCSVELMTYDWVDLEDSCSHTLGVLQIIILSGFIFVIFVAILFAIVFSDVMFLLSSSCFFGMCFAQFGSYLSKKGVFFMFLPPNVGNMMKHGEISMFFLRMIHQISHFSFIFDNL